ncbi:MULTISPECIES: sulfatase-like hydrolase/transferase [unclassified Lentimonas]|uniref:sulfatase-like hydrolase/transferase n=1 Tax=unclassified Lentimonas TaxID=2630993 RepID=UPI001324D877|nr:MULTISPECIES: sulfatase-like hydrolase/transferase [unclassified Lentimonas]CAA6679920.1 Choline-sulfatase (EC [Lentimonas sp. CC4]CAA6683444.1 Choline-sulfatase (EC [Lentimonas sp. CC6]CAA7078080.1 Choline-sulfatase (EC [Lentimonas sp. CC4]CAA7171624.1 Choline-sulfatase (EC [Lentimonas sp. CC21]CAA7181410.1 Choline-sulfatase (EC [Lentimonas sp. CC8]
MRALKIVRLLLFVALSQLTHAANKPNIVFLMTDDQRWDNFGCYGRPEFRTENIDRLAQEGVIFDNAYYAVAICLPSRVTMMSGRYLSNHKVGFSHPYNYTLSKSDFNNTYPAMLKAAGYRTGFVGKFGFPVTDEAYERKGIVSGYNIQKELSPYFDFFAGSGVHFRGAFAAWPKDETLDAIYSKERPLNERTLKTGDAMMHFLETQPKDQPFCLSISFFAVKNDKDHDMYPPDVAEFSEYDFSVPENWVEGRNTKLPEVLDNWRGVALHKQRTSTPALYQKLVRRFATQGYSVDQQVGRLMRQLATMGVLDNTVILYTSDNGRFHGSHGLYDKAILYDESVKAPFIVFDGRVAKEARGRRESALMSSVDVAPTIVSYAGLEIPDSMQGRDLTPVIEQTQDLEQWRDAVYIESLFIGSLHSKKVPANIAEINERVIADNKSYRSRGVRTERYKYFSYFEHTPVIEELYDIEKDPQEMNNLATNPEYTSVLEAMRKKAENLSEEYSAN